MKIAACFPGQALFPVSSMLEKLCGFGPCKRIVEKGIEYVGAIDAPLSDRTLLQLHTFIASVASYRIVRNANVPVSVFAEHSMGIYAALVAARALSFTLGLDIVKLAGELIDQAAIRGDYDMAAVIGLERDEINTVCAIAAEAGEVYLANVNGPRQFVLSGEKKALQIACDSALRRGAMDAKLLGMGAPIHTNLLERASRSLKKQLAAETFHGPVIPIVEHIYGQDVLASTILDLLCQQLFMPVKWARVMDVLLTRKEIDTFIELAPGNTLTKLIKLHAMDATVISLGDPEKLDEAIDQLRELTQ